MPRQVRAETNLVRAPGLWSLGPTQLELPIEVRGLSTVVRASGSLKLTPDLDVLAWISERWLSTPPLDPDGWARFTLYDLGLDFYGRPPNTRDRQAFRASIRRLMRVLVDIAGWDAEARRPRPSVATTAHLIEQLVSDLERVGSDPTKVGALRGSTFKVQLAGWLREALASGAFTYLDFAILRQLDGLAKRVWVYLQAERFKRIAEGRSAVAIGLGGPALATFGVDSYKRRVDARVKLKRAGKRIAEADSRFESVTVEPRAGGWSLVAVRIDAEQRRRVRAERERIREILADSPLGESAAIRDRLRPAA